MRAHHAILLELIDIPIISLLEVADIVICDDFSAGPDIVLWESL